MQESELPWREPSKGLELPNIDLSALAPDQLAATIGNLTEDFKVGVG